MRTKRTQKSVVKSEVSSKYIYMTDSRQLRRVTEVFIDHEGRNRVHYKAKSSKMKGQPFTIPYYHNNPPLESTFIKACSYILPIEEVMRYVAMVCLLKTIYPVSTANRSVL